MRGSPPCCRPPIFFSIEYTSCQYPCAPSPSSCEQPAPVLLLLKVFQRTYQPAVISFLPPPASQATVLSFRSRYGEFFSRHAFKPFPPCSLLPKQSHFSSDQGLSVLNSPPPPRTALAYPVWGILFGLFGAMRRNSAVLFGRWFRSRGRRIIHPFLASSLRSLPRCWTFRC